MANTSTEIAVNSASSSPITTKQSALTLAALGVVYGDIGTSPLYTLSAIFHGDTGVQLAAPDIIGAISTILWSLMVVVTLKYVLFILRTDNKGEGGVLALSALASSFSTKANVSRILMTLGVIGAALFYGDSLITPAISVLGAVEGVGVVAPNLHSWIVPVTLSILAVLFVVQKYGTAKVGIAFGPIMLLWFLTLGVSGGYHILQKPEILQAINPLHALQFLAEKHWHFLLIMGAVVLALTGAEALYADMGHFGRAAIQRAWLFCVFPCLILNYLGQGALLLNNPAAIANPFFNLFPLSLSWLAIGLATVAAVIASQAVISGAFSVTKQAIQLGYVPRMHIMQTSASEQGQIVIPSVNWMLFLGVMATVIFFQSSAALANAYGIAVTFTMLITSLLASYVYFHRCSNNPTKQAAFWVVAVLLVVMDCIWVSSCAIKFLDGGWFTLAFGVTLCLVMFVWFYGRKTLVQKINSEGIPLGAFIDALSVVDFAKAERTAIYLVANSGLVPQALLHNIKHNQVLHTENIIATVYFENSPWVSKEKSVRVSSLGKGFWQLSLHVGFMETPNIPHLLSNLAFEKPVNLFNVSYFLSRETVGLKGGSCLMRWRNNIFLFLMRNSGSVVRFFHLPDSQVVELGTRVQM